MPDYRFRGVRGRVLALDNPAYQPDELRLAKPRKYKESPHLFITLKKRKFLPLSKYIFPLTSIIFMWYLISRIEAKHK